MKLIPVKCPVCYGTDISKNGKTRRGTQRYICNDKECPRKSFILDYVYNGCKPGIDEQIIDMAANTSGIRDTARVLKISTQKVLDTLRKKEGSISKVNYKYIDDVDASRIEVTIVFWEQIESAELDEMWSFVQKKDNQRWLWLAIDHNTRVVLAYAFGKRKDEVFLQLKSLLEPFGITMFYTDDWGSYERNLDPKQHTIGKKNTQAIERKNLTLRTRIKRLCRKTICFSKSVEMHDIVVGLVINILEFGWSFNNRFHALRT